EVLHSDLNPTKGREQRGKEYVLVLSPADFNRFGLALVCPITQGRGFAREHGFAVSLSAAGTRIRGVVLCHQVRPLACKERGACWVETLPEEIVDDVRARVRTLLD
ncbi:MAG: type II toxin-antitoxin system PemK/MazF family toxin, partial [Acidobacteriota bacterium]